MKSPVKGWQAQQTADEEQDDDSDENCEDFLYEDDFLDVEDEEMSEYAHSQHTEGTDLDSDTEEPDDITALAAIHFNYNIQRNVAKKRDGSRKVKIVFPKFKNGEATVRDERIPPNFDYIQDIFQTMEEALKNPENSQIAASQWKRQTPQHMDSMLPKQLREAALQQWLHKQSLVVLDVPPTNPAGKRWPTNKSKASLFHLQEANERTQEC
eukprot:gene11453-biopygen9132